MKFLFEALHLKRVKRSGWWIAKVKDPESVADHSFCAALTGLILAKKEGADENKVMKMCLLQDLPESRINDLHKIGHRYIDFKKHETKVFKEQIESLEPELQDEFKNLFDEYQEQSTKEAIVARDADLLECLLQAKDYMDAGYKDAEDWIKNSGHLLKTESAKNILKYMKNSNEWWQGLKKVDR